MQNNIIEKQMRVHSESRKVPGCPTSVPMGMLNEDWAQRIHSQSLNRLNERGGLGIGEMVCNIERGNIRDFQDVESLPKLLNYIAAYNQNQSK